MPEGYIETSCSPERQGVETNPDVATSSGVTSESRVSQAHVKGTARVFGQGVVTNANVTLTRKVKGERTRSKRRVSKSGGVI
jgi:hypothetical protein